MTIAYSENDSAYLVDIKQVARVAVMNKVVTWKETDAFEEDVLVNKKGIGGLSSDSLKFIQKIEEYIRSFQIKAC